MRWNVVVVAITAMCVVGPAAASHPGALPGTTVCDPFVGATWVNPYPPNEKGKHFQVIVSGKTFTCKVADAYAKRFVALKIKNTAKFGMPDGTVPGGPKGYDCTSGISHIGTAYQGHCMVPKPTPDSPWFSWGPYNDS